MNLIQKIEQEEMARLARKIPEFSPGDTRGPRRASQARRIGGLVSGTTPGTTPTAPKP